MDKVLTGIVKRIVDQVSPEQIILFGSRAKKNSYRDSDYDILVLKTSVKDKRKLQQSLYLLLYGSGASVDVLVDTPDNYEKLAENKFLIHHNIKKEGIVIYERERVSK